MIVQIDQSSGATLVTSSVGLIETAGVVDGVRVGARDGVGVRVRVGHGVGLIVGVGDR